MVPLPLALLRAAGSLGDLLAPIRATPLSMATVRRLTGSLELDTGELEATLGHRLPMDLDEGLATTVDWLRTGRGA